MKAPKILIAGIGNIFLGDDGFGPEVIRRLGDSSFGEAVRVTDFGIRGYDLAFAIADGHDATILVDATPRGDAPGTLYLLELDPAKMELAKAAVDGHSLTPVAALQMVRSLGFDFKGRFYLVGCEPLVLECDDGEMKLSEPVETAVPRAIAMIQKLVRQFSEMESEQTTHPASSRPVTRRYDHVLHS
ncbi:MAG TPA: hydrogenase maturation protease [Verrucomicrobiaceae bacterium]|jgi:hydrogenase maturation protease